MKQRRKRLRYSTKIALLLSLTFLIIFIIFASFFSFMTIFNATKDSYEELEASSSIVISIMNKNARFHTINFTEANLNPSVYINIYDGHNQLVYSSRQASPHFNTLRIEYYKLYQDSGNNLFLYVNKAVTCGNQQYTIQLIKRLNNQFQLFSTIFYSLLLLGSLGILISFVAIRILSRQLLKPIRNITAIAKDITAKNLDTRIPLNGPSDELSELTDVFNTMIERLDNDFQKQRRFISDASHELRTPLAVLLGYINMLNRWGKDNPEILTNSLLRLETETRKMDKLIENLLFLARSDNNALLLKKEEFKIEDLIHEVIDEAKMIYPDNTFSSELPKHPVMLQADYNALKRVLRNLVDNSVKYSSPSDAIHISINTLHNGISIVVSDQGIGVPAQDLNLIFNRFYRVDESRSKETGGSGLGLAIVKNIIQLHNGTICAESSPGKGTRIIIFLPA